MSIFSLIKQGHAQAKEKKALEAEKAKQESKKPSYKHVVTHAATDAIATVPSSWKHGDRHKIREQNRRRTELALNGMSPNTLPRVGSSLSSVSYPSVYANPIVPLPVNYSYSSIPSSWAEHFANLPENPDFSGRGRAWKGKEREIVPGFTTGTSTPATSCGRISPSSNIGAAISGGSGGNSSGSDSETERKIKAFEPVSYGPGSRPPTSRRNSGSSERSHHLHPTSTHRRRNSETSAFGTDRHYPPPAKSTYFAASRPMSRRPTNVDKAIPPVPALPNQFASTVSPTSSDSSEASVGATNSTGPSSISSTPTPPNAGDSKVQNNVVQPKVHTRRPSLTDRRKTSEDTVKPETAADQMTRRRLSRSKPPLHNLDQFVQSTSDENHAVSSSMEGGSPRAPGVEATHTNLPDFNQVNMAVQQPSFDVGNTSSPRPQTQRRRLSKTPKIPKNMRESDSTTSNKKPRWSFFGKNK
ncbi:hypothetical protein F5Y15DRAFT_13168 [Xylariaceae sp. FL0016]|nr:hypothetical protein F5Y15DRAFT_13168 [Xylariaceae sp. FL0016]